MTDKDRDAALEAFREATCGATGVAVLVVDPDAQPYLLARLDHLFQDAPVLFTAQVGAKRDIGNDTAQPEILQLSHGLRRRLIGGHAMDDLQGPTCGRWIIPVLKPPARKIDALSDLRSAGATDKCHHCRDNKEPGDKTHACPP